MQKRSHALLAGALMRREGGFSNRAYELAFLFGSIQPDLNPFSYLKGSLRGKKLGGHTYGNNDRYIARRARRLRRREHWHIWHYYTMGKLTHYVADAFTWPHNPSFPGRGWDHHRYETALRTRLEETLSERSPALRPCRCTFPEALDRLHRYYLAETKSGGLDRDIRFILSACELLMGSCRGRIHAPEPEFLPEFLPEGVFLPEPEFQPAYAAVPVPEPVRVRGR